MDLGYSKPLYVLPFDHRDSYVSGMFHFEPPLTAAQHQVVCDSKQVIYEGFQKALARGVPKDYAAILVDEQFGKAILDDARHQGYLRALSTEKSGKKLFEFEYDGQFKSHVEEFSPTFAKVLVRYNPDDDAESNQRQVKLLRQLSDYLRPTACRFMFELLVPPTAAQMAQVKQDKGRYDRELRCDLMLRAIETLQDSGVEPDVWKIEGLDTASDYRRLVKLARRAGRDRVGCIVLGRGADENTVAHWLTLAREVDGMIGFAVGRTCFWDPIARYVAREITREQAADEIAQRYCRWADLFQSPAPESSARAPGLQAAPRDSERASGIE